MSNTLPLMPVPHLLLRRPDLAPAVVEWLLAQRCSAAGLPVDVARRRRQQRTVARASLVSAALVRTPLGLFWALAPHTDRLLGSVNPHGILDLSYVALNDKDAELTDLMRRLVDAQAKLCA
jgi:hypothetical protein